jgi:UDP-3-O-[3-hydroxymyristoyl] N-acetylglucosamine deacetylase
LNELHVARADRGVVVQAPRIGLEVDLVEHLFAALGGLSLYEGVSASVEGGEVPLLDGGALALSKALMALEQPRTPPRLAIRSAATLGDLTTRYELRPAASVIVHVEVSFEGVGTQAATWNGTPQAFLDDIAPSRTFGFLHEADALRESGRARLIDPRSVMVLDGAGCVMPPGAPMRPSELARHKLLDLIGDLFLFGGPPLGEIRAWRPGHAKNHAMARRALANGIFTAL